MGNAYQAIWRESWSHVQEVQTFLLEREDVMRKKLGVRVVIAFVAIMTFCWCLEAIAVSPIISNLPSVIIGDIGDVSGSGTTAMHLLRYENVLDLGAAVHRINNPSTTTFMKVYYSLSMSGNTLRVSNKASLTLPMTDAEVASLLAGVPPAGKQINIPPNDTMMSLIHDAGQNTPVNARSATPA